MRTYLYKVMYDAGTAPCVDDGLLSLAICKPGIRATAQEGDWIFGFGAITRLGNRLIFAAEVTEALSNGDYYRRKEFWKRADCIYRWKGERLVQVQNDVHDSENVVKDIGFAPFHGARVLLSSNFRYFGSTTSEAFTDGCVELMRYTAKVKQGHRVNLPGRVAAELGSMTATIWKQHPKRRVLGTPSDLMSRSAARIAGRKSDDCAPKRRRPRC